METLRCCICLKARLGVTHSSPQGMKGARIFWECFTLPEINSWHLKMHWPLKCMVGRFLLGSAYFQGRAVSFREGNDDQLCLQSDRPKNLLLKVLALDGGRVFQDKTYRVDVDLVFICLS